MGIQLRFRLEVPPNLRDGVGNRASKSFRRATLDGARRAGDVMARAVAARAPSDTGELKGSFSGDGRIVKGRPTGLVLSSLPDEHVEAVDQGRKPGTGVPIEEIRGWVRRNKRTASIGKQGKDKPIQTERDVRRTAFIIHRKIKRKGIEGKRFIAAARRAAGGAAANSFRAALRQWRRANGL